MAKINQEDNFAKRFGFCIRSSAIFYIPGKSVKTKIILNNYWRLKSDLEVSLIASWRELSGKLVKRESINFDNSNVLVLTPPDDIEGSCEIEAYSSSNLKIPYAAIMAVYESEKSISMVHSYTRTYSNIEVEDDETISDGHEGCWVLRDNLETESFAVLHNGSQIQEDQNIKLKITNYKNISKEINIKYPEMNPYETRVFKPIDFFPELIPFLDGKEGSAVLNFSLSRSFTRLLLGNQSIDKTQLQVRHSNFDYSVHQTNLLGSENSEIFVMVPNIKDRETKALIYPDRTKGKYELTSKSTGKINLPENLFLHDNPDNELILSRIDGPLPSRVISGIQFDSLIDKSVLPCEAPIRVIHKACPPKRLHWSIWSPKYKSQIIVTAYKKVFGSPQLNTELNLKIYSSKTKEIYESNITWSTISCENQIGYVDLYKMFEKSILDQEEYIYFSLYSSYGGFQTYVTLQKDNSFSLEHSF